MCGGLGWTKIGVSGGGDRLKPCGGGGATAAFDGGGGGWAASKCSLCLLCWCRFKLYTFTNIKYAFGCTYVQSVEASNYLSAVNLYEQGGCHENWRQRWILRTP